MLQSKQILDTAGNDQSVFCFTEAMIDLMIGDLTKEMTEAKTTEKDSQSDYEQTMRDSAEKRAADTKTLADKQKAKAELNADMEAHTEEKAATTKTLMAARVALCIAMNFLPSGRRARTRWTTVSAWAVHFYHWWRSGLIQT